jgi:Toxin PAAR-like domain
MNPAASKAGGTCKAVPDVCQVPAPPGPPVPTPFPNTGMVANAVKASTKVLCENMGLVLENSEIPSSMGDQGGSVGGVTSGTVGMKVVFKLGSQTVKAEGKGVAYQTAMTDHNNSNVTIGLHDSPSQTKILVGM